MLGMKFRSFDYKLKNKYKKNDLLQFIQFLLIIILQVFMQFRYSCFDLFDLPVIQVTEHQALINGNSFPK